MFFFASNVFFTLWRHKINVSTVLVQWYFNKPEERRGRRQNKMNYKGRIIKKWKKKKINFQLLQYTNQPPTLLHDNGTMELQAVRSQGSHRLANSERPARVAENQTNYVPQQRLVTICGMRCGGRSFFISCGQKTPNNRDRVFTDKMATRFRLPRWSSPSRILMYYSFG